MTQPNNFLAEIIKINFEKIQMSRWPIDSEMKMKRIAGILSEQISSGR